MQMMRRFLIGCWAMTVSCGLMTNGYADIYRWDNGKLIPGTEDITPGPGAQLDQRELDYAALTGTDLSAADFQASSLKNANFSDANLTGANLDAAILARADFTNAEITGANLNNTLKFLESPSGDFDGDDVLTLGDVELLEQIIPQRISCCDLERIFGGTPYLMLNVNGDAAIDEMDLRFWIHNLKDTWFGDANLDGEFNSGDLTTVLAAGEFNDDIDGNSSWAEGDWNADGDFTSADLVVALADGGFGQGPRVAAAAVPEPSGIGLLTVAFIAIPACLRKRHCVKTRGA
jgi:hypothetical protein